MKFTVFTATYNRAYRLDTLYRSLLSQTLKDFEWLVIDDGSTDNTEELFKEWISDGILDIRYYKKANGGKSRAVNYGLPLAKGEAFFIVDSDDLLPAESLENIWYYFSQIKDDGNFAGVCGLKCYDDGEPTHGYLPYQVVDWYHINRKYVGDMSDVYKTSIINQYRYPEYEGEKYCAPGFIFNQIGCKYKLRYFNKNVYQCEYLPDGLSAASARNRRKSPTCASLLYLELSKMPIGIKRKIKSSINFWRFIFLAKNHKLVFINKLPKVLWLTMPLGVLMAIRDMVLIKKDLRPKKINKQ